MRRLARIPVFGSILVFCLRCSVAARHLLNEAAGVMKWLVCSREYTNFTYDLDPLNRKQMAWFIADAFDSSVPEVLALIEEIVCNKELADLVKKRVEEAPESFGTDSVARLGRRAGWYAIARLIKPKIIVETGVDKGLGSCVLAAAIERNSREGHPGHYIGVDINPSAGFLFKEPYQSYGEIVVADSLEFLGSTRFSSNIDMFINDSDHSALHEEREYQLISRRLSNESVVIADNAHVTDKLMKFAEQTGRDFAFFRELPKNHWYRGCGIGIAFKRRTFSKGLGQQKPSAE